MLPSAIMEPFPKTLQDAIQHFSDEDVCIRAVTQMRWPDGVPMCPKCAGTAHYYLKTQKRWKCKACAKQFSVKVGTIFEDSPIGLDKWLTAMWMIANCKNGVSSYEVHRAIGVTQKTAWFMLHRIRMAMALPALWPLGGKGKEIEVDESFIGGKAKYMHRYRRERALIHGGLGNKATAFGILERGGEIRTFAVPNRRKHALHREILKHVREDTPVYSDALMSYDGLRARYQHEVIDHARGYVRGRVHTNGIENFWSLFKRTIKGTYVSIEPFHLFRYLDEQTFRYNKRAVPHRPIKDGERFRTVLAHVAGKRLTYAEATGKVGQTSATD